MASALTTAAGDRTTRYAYDGDGRLAYGYDAFGRDVREDRFYTTLSTNGVPSLQAMQSWAGANTTATDRVSRSVYDAGGRLLYAIDAAGDVTQSTYGAQGELSQTRAYATALTTAQLSALSAAPTASDIAALLSVSAGDEVARYVFDAGGRLVYQIDALGDVTESVYDVQGELISTTAYATPLSQATLSSLSASTSAETLAGDITPSAADETTRFIYDGDGRLSFKIDALGAVVGTAYDAFGDVLSTEAYATPLSGAQLIALPIQAGPADIAAALTASAQDETERYSYDQDGRRLTSLDALGASTTRQYDAFGNLVKIVDPRGNTGYFYFDARNREVVQVDPAGYVTATTYSLGDQIVEVDRYKTAVIGALSTGAPPTVDTAGGVDVTKIGRDDLDRIVSNTDADAQIETYSLDAFGDRVSTTNQVGGVITDTYDARGLLTAETLPISAQQASGTVADPAVTTEATKVADLYRYDAFGNKVTKVEAAGLTEQRTTQYGFDALNRVVSQQGDSVTATTVDTVTGTIGTASVTPTASTRYDAFGNVILTTNADNGRTFFYYDAANRKTGQVDAAGGLSAWTYSVFNNVVAARVYGDPVAIPTVAGGATPAPVSGGSDRETDYGYDLDNRQTATSIAGVLVGRYVNGAYQASTTTVTTQTVYDASGNVVQTTNGNGAGAFFYYDAAGRKAAQVDSDQYLTTYTLDAEGNVVAEHQYATAISFPVDGSTGLSALLADVSPAATDRVTRFSYDGDGRRLTQTRAGVEASTVNNLGQVVTTATDSTISFVYNGLGELTQETQATGDQTTSTYDLDGRLISTSTPAYLNAAGNTIRPTTRYVYDGLNDLTMTAVGDLGASLSSDHITQYTYGAGGRLASTTDATGFSQSFGYDAAGALTETSYQRRQSDGTSVLEAGLSTYDRLGRQTSSATADSVGGTWRVGDVQQQTYDAYGELVSKGVNGGAQQSYAFDGAGRLIADNAQTGALSIYVNDADGAQTLKIDSAGASLAGMTQSEALALVVGAADAPVNAAGLTTTFTARDARGDIVQTVKPFRQLDGSGATTSIADAEVYDAFGDVVRRTDAQGGVTQSTYDALGDLTEIQQPLVETTSAAGVTTQTNPTLKTFYDASGRKVGSEDADGNVTASALLNGTGYGSGKAVVATEYDPDGGATFNSFDVWGNVIATADALGDETVFTYDGMNRLISQTNGLTAPVTLHGTTGADVLQGGAVEYGDGGADTFVYNTSYGSLEVNDDYNGGPNGSAAVIKMGAGLTAASLTVSTDAQADAIITDGITGDQIKIDHEFRSDADGVGQLIFSDGTSLTRQQMAVLATTASPIHTTLYAVSGITTYDPDGYAHVVHGGADIIYDQSDGQLEIDTRSAVLQLGPGLTADSLVVTGDQSGDMIITDGVTGDKIQVDQEFTPNLGYAAGLDEVKLSDGSVLSRAQLTTLALTGTRGNDGRLYGTSGADTFDSRGYVHAEQGNGGADTFIYDAGYRNLEIDERSDAPWTASLAVLQMGAGVDAASIGVTGDSSGDMLITDGLAGDTVKLDGEFNQSYFGAADAGVSEIRFADGGTLTRGQLIALSLTGSQSNDGPLYLYGSSSNGVFDSRGFSHYEQSKGGLDTFVYNSGYDDLEINDGSQDPRSSSAGVLKFGNGVNAASLSFTGDINGNLFITDGVTGEEIQVDGELNANYTGASTTGVKEIDFADGGTLTRQQLIDLATTGSQANDGPLYGAPSNATFDSHGFSQYEQGQGGADTFVYKQGYGNLEIKEDNGDPRVQSTSVLALGNGITATSIAVTSDGDGNLFITDGVAGDRIRLDGEANNSYLGTEEYGVAQVNFSDGSLLTRSQLIQLAVTGSQKNDTTLYGSGSPELYGTGTPDLLDSHGYAHVEVGRGGADTFVYNAGYGRLEINEDSGSAFYASPAILALGAGISASSIHATTDSLGDVVITDGVVGDQITIDAQTRVSWAGRLENGVGGVSFADGSTMDAQSLIASAGGGGAPTLVEGTSGADTFDSTGPVVERGDGGADTFVFNAGYGQVEIDENAGWGVAGAAVLTLGAGITASSLVVSSDAAGDMIVTDGVAGDQIKVDREFLTDGPGATAFGVSGISLADGSTLSRDQLIALATTGSAANDGPLYGTAGADTLDTRGYAHFAQGNEGADTFVYDQGYGAVEISDNAGWRVASTAVLSLGAGLSAANLTVTSDSAGDMIISDGVAGDQVKVDQAFAADGTGAAAFGVSEVEFADGSSLDRAQLIALATTGSALNNGPLYGSNAADTLDTQGYGHLAQGNGGADTFIYRQGYGRLEINEDAGFATASAAVLQLGAGLTASSVTFKSDSAGDLLVSDGVAGDQIKIDGGAALGWGGYAETGVSAVLFSDGSSLTRSQIIALTTTGSVANDGKLYGSSAADTFNTNGFSHYASGGGGADTFLYNGGNGQLEISEDAGFATNSAAILQLGAGITAASLSFTSDSAGDLIVTDGIAGDQIKIDGGVTFGWGGAAEDGVAEIKLADGSSIARSRLQALVMTGSLGNEGSLYGTSLADTLDSRGYAQFEQGNGGADTFIYAQGYGQLEINEDAGFGTNSAAVLSMGAGVSASSLVVSTDSTGDILIADGTAGDLIKLDGALNLGWGSTAEYGVGSIQFADGSSLSHAQIMTLAATGSVGNNALYGTSGADTIDPAGLAHYAQGQGGADTFIYNQGYGALTINEFAGYFNASAAVLNLGDGTSDAGFTYTTDANADLIITGQTPGDVITIQNEFYAARGGQENGVAAINFANGFSLTRAQLLTLVTPANALTTSYTYNGLGERLTTANSVLGPGAQQTTDYDSQGRVTRQVDAAGHATTYAYGYDAALATAGMGVFGGWTETQTNATGLTSTTAQDYFGRTVGSTDFGGEVYANSFDTAGRLVGQTLTDADGALATTTTDRYYNTGRLAGSDLSFGWETNGVSATQAGYSYDAAGDRLTETYTGTVDGPTPSTIAYQDSTATYDALDRMTGYSDGGQDGAKPITIAYQYDDAGNIRHMTTTSVDLVNPGATKVQDYWYAYDAMNRFTTTEGTLVDGRIVRGLTGTDLTYNRAGERASETTTLAKVSQSAGVTVSWNDDHVESFAYSSGGYLSSVSLSDGSYVGGGVLQGPAYLAGLDVRDALGRVVNYIEYTPAGSIYYSAESAYDNDNNLLSQTQNTAQNDGSTLVALTTFDYDLVGSGGYDGAYAGGQLVHSHESAYTLKHGSRVDQVTTDTVDSYVWGSGPRQTGIAYTTTANPGGVQTSTFAYDAADDLSSVAIRDGTPSTVAYTTDAQGQVLSRVQTGAAATSPRTYAYFFGGRQVGEITNDGSVQGQDYAQAIAARSAKVGSGPFAGGVDGPTGYASFGTGYDPITLLEAKSSETAPLTLNQTNGFPLIEQFGGRVVGTKGGTGFPSGTSVPSGTMVRIIRPDNLPTGY